MGKVGIGSSRGSRLKRSDLPLPCAVQSVCEHEAVQQHRHVPLAHGLLACGATGAGALAGFSELPVEARVACVVVASLLSGAIVAMPTPNTAHATSKILEMSYPVPCEPRSKKICAHENVRFGTLLTPQPVMARSTLAWRPVRPRPSSRITRGLALAG
jgi:hypothetical protein